MQKYSINQPQIDILLSWIKNGDIAIPEIQRPFVWDASKVRDLIDSLYSGYPIGYLITWRNPDVRLKDGTKSEGKKILIDGQQRVTALMAALLGQHIVDESYKKVRIQIAFHPADEKFEVSNPAIENDNDWIPDISKLFTKDMDLLSFVDNYCKRNVGADRTKVYEALDKLDKITTKQIGIIELNQELDIEVVTEIFIRINSQGVTLSQADFAMSKIASNNRFDGPNIRKCIDYFCHLSIAPEFYSTFKEQDKEFTNTEYFPKMVWLKDVKDDLYDPSYRDMIRVAFTYKFERGRLKDLVSLLSGRNFVTRDYEEEIEESSFKTLKEGLFDFMNETHFKRFLMIIKSAGFIDKSLIRSQNVLNYAYILYLKLREEGYNDANIEQYVRKWFVLSILTRRYSGSPESAFDFDIKRSSNRNFPKYLEEVEEAELSDAYWKAGLVQNLDTSVASSPFFNIYLASQVKEHDKGFLSKAISVKDLIEQRGDVHHIFPRAYLQKKGLSRGQYNQIANYVYTQSEINIILKDNSPKVYLAEIKKQIEKNQNDISGITNMEDLVKNLKMNCVPEEISEMDFNNYDDFLMKRRKLMAKKIRDYYYSL